MSVGAIPVARGCGVRVRGGIYAEVGSSPGSQPIESFLIDPPKPFDPRTMGVTPRGVSVHELPTEQGTIERFLIDWVGSRHYPNVLDFIEEARRFGISRRLPMTLDYEEITSGINLLLCHRRALIRSPLDYWTRVKCDPYCPKVIPRHMHPDFRAHGGMCAALWWDDVEGGEELEPESGNRVVRRRMPSFSYLARRRPHGIEPEYQVAFFMSIPLERIVVVRDPESDIHRNPWQHAVRAGVPVEVVDQ